MTSWSFLHSWLITGFVTSSTRQVSLVEQELLTLPGGVRVTRSLVLCACFVDRCFSLSFYTFSFGHCVVCYSIYGLWLPLWYLQPLLTRALLKVHINSHKQNKHLVKRAIGYFEFHKGEIIHTVGRTSICLEIDNKWLLESTPTKVFFIGICCKLFLLYKYRGILQIEVELCNWFVPHNQRMTFEEWACT